MNERESRKQAREKTNKGLLPLSLLVIGKRRHISDKSKHILPLTLRVELVPQLVEVLVARLVEFPEPRVRPPVKRPVQQLVELPELLDHRPLELLVRQLAEFLEPLEERLEPGLLVSQDTVRPPLNKKETRGTEKKRSAPYGS